MVGGSLELRLKHFNPDGSGWEEKDHFVTLVYKQQNRVTPPRCTSLA